MVVVRSVADGLKKIGAPRNRGSLHFRRKNRGALMRKQGAPPKYIFEEFLHVYRFVFHPAMQLSTTDTTVMSRNNRVLFVYSVS